MFFINKLKYFYIVSLLLLPILTIAQNGIEKSYSRNEQAINRLRKEINDLKHKLSDMHKKESNIAKQISLIDHEMALVSRSKGLLEQQNKLLTVKIEQINTNLNSTKKRLVNLKKLYADRLVYMYKYGHIKNIELILSSSSFNQAFVRYNYLKIIAEQDERTIRSIKRKKRRVEILHKKLLEEKKRKDINLKEKLAKEKKYRNSKLQKSKLIKKIKWSESLFQKQISQKENEQQKIKEILLSLERTRHRKNRTTVDNTPVHFNFSDFGKAKGKLPWPVKGKVVSKYGKYRDPKFKTYVKNTGIEIKSALGSPVKTVFSGVVRMITYMPVYGNTVIVDHGKGYYTLYSHLDEIYVHKDEGISTGQIIATVGDSGSLKGSKLNFEIYGNQKTFNPQNWLR
jgi:septal ring factor EnvC (AmiA/AmiB activator)